MNNHENPELKNDAVTFCSTNCDILEIREEDTKPGKASARYRKMLEDKYGRKMKPPGDQPENGSKT